MCDEGHRLIFDSEKCEIRKEGSGKLVPTTVRTPDNIYILNEIEKERCCLGRESESWLWNKRMGHMNFGNLVKIRKKEAIRVILEISKLVSTMCKYFLHGKQTRTEFRSKEYSTTNPLEIVHTYPCGPLRTKGLNGEHYCILFIDDYTRMIVVFFSRRNQRHSKNSKYSRRWLKTKWI